MNKYRIQIINHDGSTITRITNGTSETDIRSRATKRGLSIGTIALIENPSIKTNIDLNMLPDPTPKSFAPAPMPANPTPKEPFQIVEAQNNTVVTFFSAIVTIVGIIVFLVGLFPNDNNFTSYSGRYGSDWHTESIREIQKSRLATEKLTHVVRFTLGGVLLIFIGVGASWGSKTRTNP